MVMRVNDMSLDKAIPPVQSHQSHQLICHGWSENVRANECMSSEGGERAFGEGHFCAGRWPWLRVSSRDILGWANAGCLQILSITELVGTMERWGSWGWVCFWRPALGCRPETMGKKKRGDLLKIILRDVSHAGPLMSASLKSQVRMASREDLNLCTWLLF